MRRMLWLLVLLAGGGLVACEQKDEPFIKLRPVAKREAKPNVGAMANPLAAVMPLHVYGGTMGEVARKLAEQTGARCVVAFDVDPDERFRREVYVKLDAAPLRTQFDILRKMGVADVRWRRDHFVVHKME